jgi:tRNA (Thr-GGU) A37 N-methylase
LGRFARGGVPVQSDPYRHGPQPCRLCFEDSALPWHSPAARTFAVGGERWQLRPNPGYWGATNPRILVLGFSKGPTQNKIIDDYLDPRSSIPFEDIPFRGIRRNLRSVLLTLGLIRERTSIDSLFMSTESVFGFSSVVRCSVAYFHRSKGKYVGADGNILQVTISHRPGFVTTCIKRHLVDKLPTSVALVIVLGANVRYVEGVRGLVGGRRLFESAAVSYAYTVNETPFVHVPHPSGGNNGAVAVFTAERAPRGPNELGMVECRRQALQALRAVVDITARA